MRPNRVRFNVNRIKRHCTATGERLSTFTVPLEFVCGRIETYLLNKDFPDNSRKVQISIVEADQVGLLGYDQKPTNVIAAVLELRGTGLAYVYSAYPSRHWLLSAESDWINFLRLGTRVSGFHSLRRILGVNRSIFSLYLALLYRILALLVIPIAILSGQSAYACPLYYNTF
jgi:hypothetical protein